MKTRIIKNIFNKSEKRCRDVKTQKACKQGWEANIEPKIKQTTSISPYISTYTAIKQNNHTIQEKTALNLYFEIYM